MKMPEKKINCVTKNQIYFIELIFNHESILSLIITQHNSYGVFSKFLSEKFDIIKMCEI